MIDGELGFHDEDQDDDFSDLEPGPDLAPMEITPELQAKLDETAKKFEEKYGHLRKAQ